ncbi:MAG: ribosome small subunit-dependent GTPase A [Clostridiales bacterium]|nr:ribosome small subunit-dependent GTPase A [Clostridiales bacterium]
MNEKTAAEYYRIIKHMSDAFVVDAGGEERPVRARKKVKLSGGLVVGDFVAIAKEGDGWVIESAAPRKNELIRPAVANIDQIVIVAAPVPLTDYYLIDKLLIHCRKTGIDCAICYNKADLRGDEAAVLKSQYKKSGVKIVSVSAIQNELEPLRALVLGKLTCLAGQSAVGKSTITNALLGEARIKTGTVSERTERGKNTTTTAQIYPIGAQTFLVDTPGFSMLDNVDIPPEELGAYYPEFEKYAPLCRFGGCCHDREPDCAVAEAAEKGRISQERYARYKRLYQELKAAGRKRK